MRHARLLIMIVAAVFVAGCARQVPAPMLSAQPVSDLDTLAYGGVSAVPVRMGVSSEGSYTLDSGDKLRVVVFGQDGLTNSYGVDAGGSITMPLIGAVPARGKTTAGLSTEIGARLRQGYIREPHVAVEIESYRPFFILGEVTFPGQYPYVANMTVETAVAIAGGFSPRALHDRVEISRPIGGQATRSAVPLGTPVRPGDTVIVAERWF
jgi:polysaccharide export outer membrane protein